MKIYEFSVKVYLLSNIRQENALEKIAQMIDKSLISTENYQNFHNKNAFKFYNFNSLFPLEKDGIYKEEGIYSTTIRTVDGGLAKYFSNTLTNIYTADMKVLKLENKMLKQGHIDKLYNITPTIIKSDEGYWRNSMSLEDYEKRIAINIIKKYNLFFNTKIDENFELFNRIEFTNSKPIATSYKNIKLLGDKLNIHVADNETAQKLARFALGSGLGEINARGYGFINYKLI